jgi:hypothetical protein
MTTALNEEGVLHLIHQIVAAAPTPRDTPRF